MVEKIHHVKLERKRERERVTASQNYLIDLIFPPSKRSLFIIFIVGRYAGIHGEC